MGEVSRQTLARFLSVQGHMDVLSSETEPSQEFEESNLETCLSFRVCIIGIGILFGGKRCVGGAFLPTIC